MTFFCISVTRDRAAGWPTVARSSMLRPRSNSRGARVDDPSAEKPSADQEFGPNSASIWAAMSHEIRTPLMGVVGMLEILGRTSLTEEQRRIIATVEHSSIALMRIVDDVLDFAKLDSNSVTLEPTATDIGVLLEE